MTGRRLSADGQERLAEWFHGAHRREGEYERVREALTSMADDRWANLYWRADDLTGPGRRLVYIFVPDLDHGVQLVVDLDQPEPGVFDLMIRSLDRERVRYLKQWHTGDPP